ncbi:hypothetical protein C1646_755203 [Rhizophagus diaphanus]|nr:hypothetical protein C1646_755203 [Rhizophagus diaphanus] [Rhizophagus sp. MUCL 43196]
MSFNRLWCHLTIPLLWENPFSICTENNDFIEIYLCNLNNDFITILNEYKIINNSLFKNTLFNYPSFLKYLNTYEFITSVDKWVDYIIRNSKFEISYLFKNFVSVSKLIFKIFIENEIKLHTLEIEISDTHYRSYFNEILELILQNQNFIHNIGNLKLCINNYDENMDHVLQITHLHQNPKKILICGNYTSLYQSLLLSKDYNCSNTLNTITFYYVNFRKIINLDKVFEQLNVLKSVHIINCSFLNNSFTQQIINLSKPFKLKSLILNEYCKNIKFFALHEFEDHIIYKIFDLIENIKQNLNYLTINIEKYNHLRIGSSIILKNLGQALPSKLEPKGSDNISHYVKEYIMKGERVKYLAIKDIKNNNQLSDLRDEVEEFKLYNIGVRSYDDLLISGNKFIKNIR